MIFLFIVNILSALVMLSPIFFSRMRTSQDHSVYLFMALTGIALIADTFYLWRLL